jgi:hypothetical protein
MVSGDGTTGLVCASTVYPPIEDVGFGRDVDLDTGLFRQVLTRGISDCRRHRRQCNAIKPAIENLLSHPVKLFRVSPDRTYRAFCSSRLAQRPC